MHNSTKHGREKNARVVLTYDDAIDQHLNNAIPVLDSLGLKATFYLTAFSTSMQTRLNDWKKLAVNGHELGNHTLFHPPGKVVISVGGGQPDEKIKSSSNVLKASITSMTKKRKRKN